MKATSFNYETAWSWELWNINVQEKKSLMNHQDFHVILKHSPTICIWVQLCHRTRIIAKHCISILQILEILLRWSDARPKNSYYKAVFSTDFCSSEIFNKKTIPWVPTMWQALSRRLNKTDMMLTLTEFILLCWNILIAILEKELDSYLISYYHNKSQIRANIHMRIISKSQGASNKKGYSCYLGLRKANSKRYIKKERETDGLK